MQLTIYRTKPDLSGTFGMLFVESNASFITLEPPWKNNIPNLSCIPAGEYVIRKHNSPKFGKTFQVMKVSGRDDILFHVGNYRKDTHGCILIGGGLIQSSGGPSITGSKVAFENFMNALKGVNEGLLTIHDSSG